MTSPTDAQAALERRATERVADIGATMAAQLLTLTSALFDVFADQIEELRGDQVILEMLRASTESNLENVAQLLRGHIPIEELRIPPAAEEYARRLAQRGISPNALARAYRLGQQRTLDWCLDQLESEPETALPAARMLMDVTFRYIDITAEAALSAYESERERWLANRNTVRLEVLESVLSGHGPDIARAESALGYRLRQHHLGLLVWTSSATSSATDLRQLERLLAQISKALGGNTAPLFVPRDRATGWGWAPLGRQSTAIDLEVVRQVVAEAPAGVHVALGTPGAGEAGFRASHHEAIRAQRVAMVAQDRARPVTAYGDPGVRAAALLATDLDSTRQLVRRALGDLASDTEPTARLRETLLTFLSEQNGYASTAAKLHLHKNTVRYRVERAMESRGKPLDEDRLDLELALIACEWLGSEVLTTAGG